MELTIWSGDKDLPSIHFESLQLLTYVRISGVPVKVKVSGNPLWSPKNVLPVLSLQGKHYTTLQEVVNLFSSLDVDPDQHLDASLKSDIAAYTAMLKEKLYPAIQYTWWLDQKNYETVTRPCYAKASTWPFNFFYPSYYECKANELLEAMFNSTEDLDRIASEVFASAQVCLNSLSTILGNKKYFFGDDLSSFDATLYAYLTPTLKKDFPNKKLVSHINGCANLVEYVDRMTEELFPEVYKAGRTARQDGQEQSPPKESRIISKRTHIIISALIALTSVSSFAYLTGVIDFGKKAAENEETSNEGGPNTGSFYENLYS